MMGVVVTNAASHGRSAVTCIVMAMKTIVTFVSSGVPARFSLPTHVGGAHAETLLRIGSSEDRLLASARRPVHNGNDVAGLAVTVARGLVSSSVARLPDIASVVAFAERGCRRAKNLLLAHALAVVFNGNDVARLAVAVAFGLINGSIAWLPSISSLWLVAVASAKHRAKNLLLAHALSVVVDGNNIAWLGVAVARRFINGGVARLPSVASLRFVASAERG